MVRQVLLVACLINSTRCIYADERRTEAEKQSFIEFVSKRFEEAFARCGAPNCLAGIA